MRKIFLTSIALLVFYSSFGQDNPVPQILVSGEGKIQVVPDQVAIKVAVENKGNQPAEVKKLNDETVARVIKEIKECKLPKEDVKTQHVSLSPIYDYQKKKYTYQASQSIAILLKDITQYDLLIQRLIDAGITQITGIEFKSSKIEQLKSEARKLAMAEAKRKAEDYVLVLNQKVGKAINISDQSSVYYAQPVMTRSAMLETDHNAGAPKETIAIGEIEITATVNVAFQLE